MLLIFFTTEKLGLKIVQLHGEFVLWMTETEETKNL